MPQFLVYRTGHYSETYAIILGTSVIALSYNVVHSLMIQQTSAVTTTVIGQAKIIGLLVLSALLLGACPCCALLTVGRHCHCCSPGMPMWDARKLALLLKAHKSWCCAGEKKVFTANMTVGTVLAIIGFFSYSHFRLQKQQRQKESQSLLPTQTGEPESTLLKKDSGIPAITEDSAGFPNERREDKIRAHPTMVK